MDKILLRTLWRAKYIVADSVEDITDKYIRPSLLPRNVEWKISDQDTEFVILGRPALETLGINTRDILGEVCDKFS